MLKLVENDVELSENNAEREQRRREEEQRQSRKQYLEMAVEMEREEALNLKRLIEKTRREAIRSLVYTGLCFLIAWFIWRNAASVLLALVRNPVLAVMVFGGVIKFISNTVELVREHVPMFIWCEQEKKGKYPEHNNYVRQYQYQEKKCRELETELNDLRNFYEVLRI